MNKSKVFFTDLRTRPGYNILDKLSHLMEQAGIETIDFEDKFTAVKLHFGEPGNLAYIRPNYVAQIVKKIQELGGKVFLTDANTLYTGQRANAVDHLEAANVHGFNRIAMGCDIIIADGLKGTDFKEVPIHMKHSVVARIGTAIVDSDILISVNHFKGHDMTGFGGAIKNLGMGCGSRGGKLWMHSASKPTISKEDCVACGMCIRYCSQNAIHFDANHRAEINYDLCIGCGQCVAVCRYGAARVAFNESASIANEKIAEYACAAIKDKPNFHISFVMDVSPNCDCWSNNDMPIVPNLGIAASFDPVALDRACVDMVNQAIPIKGSLLDQFNATPGSDKFSQIYPDTNWQAGLDYAEEIGLGTQDYELITVK